MIENGILLNFTQILILDQCQEYTKWPLIENWEDKEKTEEIPLYLYSLHYLGTNETCNKYIYIFIKGNKEIERFTIRIHNKNL